MRPELVITKIETNHAQGGTKIYWDILFGVVTVDPNTTQFKIYSSQDENQWTLVAAVPINEFSAVDTNSYKLGSFNMLWYKVNLENQNAPQQVILASKPVNIEATYHNRYRNYRILKEISRKFRLLGRLAGEKCSIYKRKRFGAPCPVDSDPLANLPQKPFCHMCFGTGISGGYFLMPEPGYVYATPQDSAEPVTEIGRMALSKLSGLLYSPHAVYPNDLIRLHTGKDDIYEISLVRQIQYGGAEAEVYQIEAVLKPKNHPVYTLAKPVSSS